MVRQSPTPFYDGLTPEKQEFVRWLIMPEFMRDPTTQKALAEKLGVVENTLYNWRSTPDIIEARVELFLNTARWAAPDFMQRIVKDAMNGSAASQSYLMDILELRKRSDQGVAKTVADALTGLKDALAPGAAITCAACGTVLGRGHITGAVFCGGCAPKVISVTGEEVE